MVFAATKFQHYIYGKKVIVETDHQPLITIQKKSLFSAPARLQRLLLQWQRFDTELVHKSGKKLLVADTLSRAYIPGQGTPTKDIEVLLCTPIAEKQLHSVKES